MSIQQTGASMPGGGRRVQGVVVPDAVTDAIGRDLIEQVIEARDPGLTQTLQQLRQIMGGGASAFATLPAEKLRGLAVKKGPSTWRHSAAGPHRKT